MVPLYTSVDGRVGYTFWQGRAEAFLAVFNIFDDMHYEYPPGVNFPDPSSVKVGRRAVLKVNCR